MRVLDVSLSTTINLNLTGIKDSIFTITCVANSSLGTAFPDTLFGISLLLSSQPITGQQILLLNNLLLGQLLGTLFAT